MSYMINTHDELASFLAQPKAVMVVGATWCSTCKPQLILTEKICPLPVYYADVDLVAGLLPNIMALPAIVKCEYGELSINQGQLPRNALIKFLE